MNGNLPAYPLIDNENIKLSYGLTKRELFAAMAMQGLLSSFDKDGTWTGLDCEKEAVKMADALLKELEK